MSTGHPAGDSLIAFRDDVVPLTQELVRAPSPNPPGDERAAAAVVRDYLSDVPGISVAELGPRPQRPTLVVTAGEGSPRLALAAHLDTHPVDGEWSFDPFAAELADDRILGLGTTDNKGAAAAMAAVFRGFAAAWNGPGTLVYIANADEETGGREGILAVAAQLPPLDAVVVAEPSGIETSYERLFIAARGTSRFRITATGTATHSSLADRPGVDNALERLIAIASRLDSQLPLLQSRHPRYGLAPRLIPVQAEGGYGWGVIPDRATILLELRVTPGLTQQQVEDELAAAFASDPDIQGGAARVEFADGSLRWMAPSDVPEDDPLVAACVAAWEQVLAAPAQLGCFPGGTDARLFAELGLPAVAGIGPGALTRAHRPDEYVTLAELDTAVQLYSAITTHYLQAQA